MTRLTPFNLPYRAVIESVDGQWVRIIEGPPGKTLRDIYKDCIDNNPDLSTGIKTALRARDITKPARARPAPIKTEITPPQKPSKWGRIKAYLHIG